MNEIPPKILERIEEARDKKLQKLDLGWYSTGYHLKSIPGLVFELEHLEELSLRGSSIKEIPKEIAKLKNLKNLDLVEWEQINIISQDICYLPSSLEVLELCWDLKQNIPSYLSEIPDLRLWLYNLPFKTLPESITKLTNITELYLYDNKLKTVPKSITKLTNLTKLGINNSKKLKIISKSITKLTNIIELELVNSQLRTVPESISKLVNISRLYLWHNQLKTLPESISKLVNLTELYLSDNQLKTLPKSIAKLINLTELDLSRNHLTSLPKSLGKLTNLTYLDLSNNQLKTLPESLGNLTNLTELHLSENQLTSLPESLGLLTYLKELDFRNNQFTVLPKSVYPLSNLIKINDVEIPEKYRGIPLSDWQAKWLIHEDNAKMRRLLIQVIGYEKICEELEAIELDKWREYTLLKIDTDVDIETIHLLKMSCPSTEHIHVLRVPPNIDLAREAITWVNWGIDPEEFDIET